MIRLCYWLNESHLLVKFVIFQETFQLIRKAVQDLTYKKNCMLWFACCLLELDSGRVINIVTKKNFFSFLFVFVMVFCVKSSENKSKIIIDNVCFTGRGRLIE